MRERNREPIRRGRARWPRRLLAGALAGGIALWAALGLLAARGERFFAAGRTLVGTLDALGAAARARDDAAFAAHFRPEPAAGAVGLLRFLPAEERDGVRVLRLQAPGRGDRRVALAEWLRYLNGFDRIDEVGFHIDRLEEWRPGRELAATVRFELIGTPHGEARAGIDRATFRLRFGRGAAVEILATEIIEGERVIADRPQFVDVAHAAGVDFRQRYYPAFLDRPLRFGMIRYGAGGISAVDYDNDGFYDLFIPDGVYSRLLRNRGDGSFEDVTERAGLGGLDGVSVGVFADYDNDGYKDLFVSRTFRPNQLFHNNGDGTFKDVTARSGLGADCCTTVAAWADYDNDGRLDLYVGRYLDPRRDIPTTFYARNGEPNRLYHNNGDGTFTDVTDRAGVGDTGLCLGVAWGDYDGDGFPDLYLANDFGRKTLYHNNGDGTFRDVTVASGTLAYGAGMSSSFGDFDNDGRLDIYVTNIRSEHAWFAAPPTVLRYLANAVRQGVMRTDAPLYWQIFRQSGFGFTDVFRQMAAGNNLLHNRGDGTFEDITARAGAAPVGWFWGAGLGDFDNDGWLDIYAADGWVYNRPGTEIELDFLDGVVGRQRDYKRGIFFDPRRFGDRSWHGWERNRHLRNNGDGTFREIGRATGADLLTNSRGVAVADFWNRGRLDIAVAASGDRHALLRNELDAGRHWLQVELVGARSNRDGVGARVTLRTAAGLQMREVAAGDGYASQSAMRLHFGLGRENHVEEMTVLWPASRRVQRFTQVAADRIVAVYEDRQELTTRSYRRPSR